MIGAGCQKEGFIILFQTDSKKNQTIYDVQLVKSEAFPWVNNNICTVCERAWATTQTSTHQEIMALALPLRLKVTGLQELKLPAGGHQVWHGVSITQVTLHLTSQSKSYLTVATVQGGARGLTFFSPKPKSGCLGLRCSAALTLDNISLSFSLLPKNDSEVLWQGREIEKNFEGMEFNSMW